MAQPARQAKNSQNKKPQAIKNHLGSMFGGNGGIRTSKPAYLSMLQQGMHGRRPGSGMLEHARIGEGIGVATNCPSCLLWRGKRLQPLLNQPVVSDGGEHAVSEDPDSGKIIVHCLLLVTVSCMHEIVSTFLE